MRTNWTITVDHIAEPGEKAPSNQNAVGMIGPRDATLTHDQIKNHKDRVAFKMYDDDKNLYYSGFMVPGDEGEAEFGPLDDFGTPNAGCTEIKIKNKSTGEWETV